MTDMAPSSDLRQAITSERAQLVHSIQTLREQVEHKRRIDRMPLPVLVGAAVAGFLVAGGVRAALRLAAFSGLH